MKTKQLHIQCPEDLHKALRLLAIERDTTMSALVLDAIARLVSEAQHE